MRKFIALLSIAALTACHGCGDRRPKYGIFPQTTVITYRDKFTPEQKECMEKALDFYIKCYDDKFKESPRFLPGPRPQANVHIFRKLVTCPGNKGLYSGCSLKSIARIKLSAGYYFHLPITLHELCHYSSSSNDPNHKDPRWKQWNAWCAEKYIEFLRKCKPDFEHDKAHLSEPPDDD